jgi:hypothetical protein
MALIDSIFILMNRVDLMTQVLILFGVFLLALMLHYFIVMEGFQGSGATAPTTSQTPFSILIDKLTFFSIPPAPPTAMNANAAEASATKADAKNVNGAPTAEVSIKGVKIGPKDTANESVAERTKIPLIPETVSSKVTDAIQQGKEYLRSGCKPKPIPTPTPTPGCKPKPGPNPTPNSCKCPEPKPVPFPCNSSDYIRKDQIPCWGCSLK